VCKEVEYILLYRAFCGSIEKEMNKVNSCMEVRMIMTWWREIIVSF